jgi:hypothetical protein
MTEGSPGAGQSRDPVLPHLRRGPSLPVTGIGVAGEQGRDTAANTCQGGREATRAICGPLPAAIGDLAFQAAASLVDGVGAIRLSAL